VLAYPAELRVEKDTSKICMLETMPSQEPKPWRRGRPRKDMKKGEEDHLSDELSVHRTIEESVRFTHWSEPVGTTGRGDRRRKGREKASATSVESPTHQLEQAQLAIAKIYQENKELRCQLAVKDQETPSS